MAKKTIKKATVKRPAATKKVQRATPAAVKKASKPTPKPVAKPTPKAAAPAASAVKAMKPASKACKLDSKSLRECRDMLLKLRERLTGQITNHADDSLKQVDDTSTEDRTDDFDREFALNLVSSEHDALFEIDSALRRLEEGLYGLCDSCGTGIEKMRLHALPFARMCVRCQSEVERGRARYRPFGESLAQGVEHAGTESAEPEEAE
jgi:DnaK suppressor protein